ncbi:hypothetical protein Agabi119p4_10154 [Agaricus bisporus var. burnettii]|uniref:DUF6533 domain-containing protein n=1 Tax=Agaricus bisporus var. burnettii TaxID=192524 RepID=A0A8H7C2D5_AGABI|nr:hypothetical protein Agabi119p4_10154 [Agaricus bisporus var. burnettii]
MGDSLVEVMGRALRLSVLRRYVDFAAGSLLVYDSLLVLDLEVTFIWQSKWSLMKVMYIVNRYTTFIELILLFIFQTTTRATHCPGLLKAEWVLYVLGIYFAEFIFAMRTYVICGKRKIFWVPIGIFGFGTLLYNLIYNFSILNRVQFLFIGLVIDGCLPVSEGLPLNWSNGWIFVVFLTIYDGAMVILIGLVTLGAWRSDARIRSDLFQVLYGEGVLFYIYILVFSIASQVAVSISNPYLFIFMGRVVRSILASRVMLHIREVAHRRSQSTIIDPR